MKPTLITFVAALTLALAGCASTHRDRFAQPAAGLAKRPSPYLLFDRLPSPVNAGESLTRSPWPTVDRGIQVREFITFQERLIDHQGGRRDEDSSFQRRFSTRRHGFLER